jgi:hypothetical protein
LTFNNLYYFFLQFLRKIEIILCLYTVIKMSLTEVDKLMKLS